MVKKTSYDYLYYVIEANLPLTPKWVRKDFKRSWKELDKIIERDYQLKKK
jgi:hypothetical protein